MNFTGFPYSVTSDRNNWLQVAPIKMLTKFCRGLHRENELFKKTGRRKVEVVLLWGFHAENGEHRGASNPSNSRKLRENVTWLYVCPEPATSSTTENVCIATYHVRNKNGGKDLETEGGLSVPLCLAACISRASEQAPKSSLPCQNLRKLPIGSIGEMIENERESRNNRGFLTENLPARTTGLCVVVAAARWR